MHSREASTLINLDKVLKVFEYESLNKLILIETDGFFQQTSNMISLFLKGIDPEIGYQIRLSQFTAPSIMVHQALRFVHIQLTVEFDVVQND